MNALNREIKPGEEVVVAEEHIASAYKGLEHRVFVCMGGFGMMPFTAGTKVYGYYKEDAGKPYEQSQDMIRGPYIDVAETKRWQEEHPKEVTQNDAPPKDGG